MCNLFSVDLNDSSKDNSKELKDPVKFFEDKRPALEHLNPRAFFSK